MGWESRVDFSDALSCLDSPRQLPDQERHAPSFQSLTMADGHGAIWSENKKNLKLEYPKSEYLASRQLYLYNKNDCYKLLDGFTTCTHNEWCDSPSQISP